VCVLAYGALDSGERRALDGHLLGRGEMDRGWAIDQETPQCMETMIMGPLFARQEGARVGGLRVGSPADRQRWVAVFRGRVTSASDVGRPPEGGTTTV